MVSDNNKLVNTGLFYAPEAKILVVDDTRMNLIVMKDLLKQTGIQIDTADSGRECLFLTERSKYNIIFLDIRMPEMDGIETLRRLLAQDENKDTPVVALTADTISESKNEYIKEGFSEYLSKPIDFGQLVDIILRYLPVELVQEAEEVKNDTPAGRTDENPDIAGLDAAKGVRACGTAETFQKALREFYLTGNERIKEIENYIDTENYTDYTIKVHALKSTSRIIGAERLSEMAQYLEECGDNKNFMEIKEKTTELLEHYKELTKAIGAYINEREDNHERPVIEQESLMDALHTIYEYAEVFDFDSADSIMEMLDEYTIPDEYYEAIKKLKVLLIGVERDAMMRHIKSMEEQMLSEPAKNNSLYIPNVNTESALEALGGSVSKYINLLKVFTEDETERLKQMDECIRTENIALYAIYAHSIKGSATIIGVPELSKLAEQLELAGKSKNIEYIHANHNEFITKMNHIIEDLIFFLQQYRSLENQENEKGQGSKEFLHENLAKIDELLTDYEMDAAEEALKMLGNMQWSTAISVIISEIGQRMMTFDYEDARLLVGKLLEMEEK